jgi:hypothetical protein
VADAIGRRGTLDVRQAYDREARVTRFAGPLDWQNHTRTGTAGTFSVHDPGLPALIALVFRQFGVPGVRVLLGLIAGLVPFLFYAIARSRGLPVVDAAILAISCALGLPFLAASGQIYPDLVSGVALLTLVTVALQVDRAPLEAWQTVVAACLLALLPWLHIKNAVAALMFAGTIAWLALRHRANSPARRRVAYVVAPLALSLLGRLAYNLFAFGHPTGPLSGVDAAGATVRQAAMIFLGLHFDQLEGLFLHQPLFVIGLAGLAVLWRRARCLSIGVAAAYLAILLPNAFHNCWYGCWSMGGRFMWSVAGFWFVPVVFFYAELGRQARSMVLAATAPAIAYQVVLWHRWSGWAAHHLYSQLNANPVERNSLFSVGWARVLPSYMDFDHYLTPVANVLALTIACGLVAAGILFSARVKARSHER